MTPQHTSYEHLFCFMFHLLVGETVKQVSGPLFHSVSPPGTTMKQQELCILSNPIGAAHR
jgi:hypothetical protein